jgi:hypothetical protein
VQVHGKGGIGVGAGVDGAIVIVVLGHRDPLGSGELLFQVMDDGLLLLPSECGSVLTRSRLIQGLVCGSHSGDKSLMLSLRGSDSGRGVILLPLSGGSSHGGMLLINEEVGGSAQHGRQGGGG